MYSKNSRNAGRPVTTVELNFNNLTKTRENVKAICSNPRTKTLVLKLCDQLKDDLCQTVSVTSQTPQKIFMDSCTQTASDQDQMKPLSDDDEEEDTNNPEDMQ